jgi:branched-chain amino acid transport system permease protein
LAGIYAAVPYVVWYCTQQGIPLFVSFGLALVFGILVSVACEAINHRPLRRKGASDGAHLVSSLGIFIILVQLIAISFGNETKVLRIGVDASTRFIGATLTRTQITAAILAVVLLAAYVIWLWVTDVGLRLRALADNPTEIALRGYNVRRLHLLAFGLSGALASGAAILSAYDLGFDPNGGLVALLLAIVAMIIGGRQSFLGPIIGSIVLGVTRNAVVWYWSAKWQDAATFLLLAACLIFLPNGLLGRKMRMEAAST